MGPKEDGLRCALAVFANSPHFIVIFVTFCSTELVFKRPNSEDSCGCEEFFALGL